MARIYADMLKRFGNRDQRTIFQKVTAGCDNIQVIACDSMHLELPTNRVAFAFIDGNHDPEYVRNDFGKIWPKVVPGGMIAFNDYGGNLPQTTSAIDGLIKDNREEIAEYVRIPSKTLIFLRRRA